MELVDLDGFCGSPFWDWNTSWNTTDPDVTLCFEKTALVWSPCLFLWLFSPLEVYYLVHSRYRDIPWNWLNLSKL
ncbi:PREDICTED: multidrug resistance-associated protein 1-like, partial [Diuraphis noxia]|uniref:multidrug resistance-associated protein 1-like n=1 Tax=Diuraphis noxia TaxID=143948 RepID=UPI0007638A9A